MYGICGTNRDREDVPCKVDQGPKTLEKEHITELEEYCPELVMTYGNELCCDASQIANLDVLLAFKVSRFITCPACANNLRRSYCAFTCSPKQSLFVNVTQTEPTPEEVLRDNPEVSVKRVVAVDFFISHKYVTETYESCKNLFDTYNTLRMDSECGAWVAENCTAERWFDSMGSIKSGYDTVDIKYRYIGFPQEFPDKSDHNNEESEIHAQEKPSTRDHVESAHEIAHDFQPLVLNTFKCSEEIYSISSNARHKLFKFLTVNLIVCKIF